MKPITLEEAVKKAGGARKVAEAIGVSVQAVYRVIKGDFHPSDELLKYVKLKRVYVWR